MNNETWQRAVRLAIDTLRSQQRSSEEEHLANATNDTAVPPGLIKRGGEWETRFGANGGGVYRFQRLARTSTETRSDGGFGEVSWAALILNRSKRVIKADPHLSPSIFPFCSQPLGMDWSNLLSDRVMMRQSSHI